MANEQSETDSPHQGDRRKNKEGAYNTPGYYRANRELGSEKNKEEGEDAEVPDGWGNPLNMPYSNH